jgi:hypothetical protein
VSKLILRFFELIQSHPGFYFRVQLLHVSALLDGFLPLMNARTIITVTPVSEPKH